MTGAGATGATAGKLRTEPGFERPDDIYEMLLDAHHGLSDEQSWRVTAKLVLLLANHIGDPDVIRDAAVLARAASAASSQAHQVEPR